jgi:hypothetical protein
MRGTWGRWQQCTVHEAGAAGRLAELVNEEAALVYEVMERACQQPSDNVWI